MKGPYERLKYDLRRLWECPVCKRRERTDGTVTFRHCPCGTKKEGGQPVVMQLIADGPQRLVPPITAARGQCADAGEASDTLARSASEGEAGLEVRSVSEGELTNPADSGTRFGPG
jgi:hypothetical protein